MNDDDLRDQMRRADPAASLRPLAQREVSGLLAKAQLDVGAPTAPRRRSGWKPAAASILVAAAAVGIFAGLKGSPDVETPPVVARVSAGSSGAEAKCPPPTAEGLEAAELAVEATVSSIDDDAVTLRVTRTFAGSAVDELQVAQTSGATEVLLGGTSFEVGAAYLVAVEDGVVKGCGYSGVVSPSLTELYGEAFGG
ncbi:hypothetical protein [Kineosporia succinea]|uniref:Uncharacterized protein n=1 Tax=Kineosporia succinea TaxID=84632 RepID=A0ABT9NX77_9ACTN|nr:hypothetical protein [Kineosporia succinea]MDP9825033.1 hypothetical protein [Kineosporia succinea]